MQRSVSDTNLSAHSSLEEEEIDLERERRRRQQRAGHHGPNSLYTAALTTTGVAKANRFRRNRKEKTVAAALEIAGGIAIAAGSWTPSKVIGKRKKPALADTAYVATAAAKGKIYAKRDKTKTVASALRVAGAVAIAAASWTRQDKPPETNGLSLAGAVTAAQAVNKAKKSRPKYRVADALKIAGGVAIAAGSWVPNKRSMKGAGQAARAMVKAKKTYEKKQEYNVASALRVAGAVAIAGVSWTKQSDTIEEVPEPVPERRVILVDTASSPIPPPTPTPDVPLWRGEETPDIPTPTPDIPIWREAETPVINTPTPDLPLWRGAETPQLPRTPSPDIPLRAVTAHLTPTATPPITPDIPYRLTESALTPSLPPPETPELTPDIPLRTQTLTPDYTRPVTPRTPTPDIPYGRETLTPDYTRPVTVITPSPSPRRSPSPEVRRRSPSPSPSPRRSPSPRAVSINQTQPVVVRERSSHRPRSRSRDRPVVAPVAVVAAVHRNNKVTPQRAWNTPTPEPLPLEEPAPKQAPAIHITEESAEVSNAGGGNPKPKRKTLARLTPLVKYYMNNGLHYYFLSPYSDEKHAN